MNESFLPRRCPPLAKRSLCIEGQERVVAQLSGNFKLKLGLDGFLGVQGDEAIPYLGYA